MDENNSSYLRRKELKDRGVVELPVNIDTERYFIGDIRLKDAFYLLPFLIVSLFIGYLIVKNGTFSPSIIVLSFIPALLAFLFVYNKHPDRRNVMLAQRLGWRINYLRSNNTYEFQKEGGRTMEKDIRSQLGVYNIANDCYETIDNRLVKVIEVSSVNITGMSKYDRKQTLEDYQTFLNNLRPDEFPFQPAQVAKPVNLQSYIAWAEGETRKSTDKVKRLLADSYIDMMNDIQKSKSMVSKSRYVIVSEKIGLDKNKAIDKVYRRATDMVTSIENMLSQRYKLDANILDNKNLLTLLYSTIDYQSSQMDSDVQLEEELDLPFTFMNDELKVMKDNWQEKNANRIR